MATTSSTSRRHIWADRLSENGWARTLCLFVLLVILNRDTLTLPPYWDAVVGLFNQASWLEQHDFDLPELVRQPGYTQGGPNVRPANIIAFVLALMYRCFAPTTLFVIAHVATIAAAAASLSLLYGLLKVHVSRSEAALWCAAGAANPIFSGQVAAIYLEMPVAFLTIAVLALIIRKRYWWAVMLGIIGPGVKGAFFLVGATVLVWLAYQLARDIFTDGRRINRKQLFLLLIPVSSFTYSVIYVVKGYGGAGEGPLRIPDADFVFLHVTRYFPDQVVLVIVSLILAVVYLWRRSDWSWEWFDTAFLLATAVYGGWTFYFLHFHSLPRYSAMFVLPLMGLVGLLAPKVTGVRVSQGLASVVVVWGVVNSDGDLLPAPSPLYARSGDVLERSREYLTDQRAIIELCHLLEQSHRDSVIIAKYPFAQMLTMPALGYVRTALPNVRVLGLVPLYADCKPFLPENLSESVISIYSPTVFEQTWQPSMAPDRDVQILYINHENRTGSLIAYSLPASSIPQDADAWVNWGDIARRWGKYDRTEYCYQQALNINPASADALGRLGVLYSISDNERSIQYLEHSLAQSPDNAFYNAALGHAYARRGSLDQAMSRYEEAVRLDPHYIEARRELQLLRLRRSRARSN